MRWFHSEYILKGIYLGLLFFVALQQPDGQGVGLAPLCALVGLGLGLLVAAVVKLRLGFRPRGRWIGFLLFLLLDSPRLVYAGILAGMAVAAYLIPRNPRMADPAVLLAELSAGGAGLGLVFGLLRTVERQSARLGLSLLLAVAMIGSALFLFGYEGKFLGFTISIPAEVELVRPELLGYQLLLGIPIFYLLAFAGRKEESEIEIGALCAALGVGLLEVSTVWKNPNLESAPFLLPLLLYFLYTWRIMPGLRVFKHTLRGHSFAQVSNYRMALLSFRRALELDPKNRLAQEGLWSVHRSLDLPRLAKDPQTLALVNFDLCLARTGSLLLQSGPSAARLEESHQLLNLVQNQRPDMRARVHYWRAVAYTHAGQFEQAEQELLQLLDGSGYAAGDPHRRMVLMPGWQLALTLHPELRRRVGEPQLAVPGRRMEAIASVERHLAEQPDDPDARGLKRVLYQDLTESDYQAGCGPTGTAAEFDHAYAQQLGLALLNNSEQWRRGAAYLRMAARGLPASGPSIYVQIAQACDRGGDTDGAWQHYELAKLAGRAAGAQNLMPEDRQLYFATVKMLGDAARERGDFDAAIENYRLYVENDRSGLETLRILADLYEKKGDPLVALHYTEMALVYNGRDKDLLDRRDRYYYSVMPEDLRARRETYGGGADAEYCLRKAKSLLDVRDADIDLIDWAQHLIELALVLKPESVRIQVLRARTMLRRGERDQALALLEGVKSNKPEKFASGDDEEAWYQACQLLGRLYLDELGRPDLAVPCLSEFRKSSKSGADTLYRLGQAYEQIGERQKAVKCYEHVVAYDGHPLVYDARAAIDRLHAG